MNSTVMRRQGNLIYLQFCQPSPAPRYKITMGNDGITEKPNKSLNISFVSFSISVNSPSEVDESEIIACKLLK